MLGRQIIFFMIMVFLISSCADNTADIHMKTFPTIKDIPSEKIKSLVNKKIFFGHQSVGDDILAGINDLSDEHSNLKFNIVKTVDGTDFSAPVFAHSIIGTNEKPTTKSNDFKDIMISKIPNKAEIAFYKFCFLDINRNIDIDEIFEHYKNTMNQVKANNPDTLLIHFTTPLMTVQSGPKAWLKKIIGKPIGGIEDNIARGRFNTLIRKEYAGTEPLFDIAQLESTFPDGSRSTFEVNGEIFEALAPVYTYDGGHLNKLGRKHIAEQFVIFLSEHSN